MFQRGQRFFIDGKVAAKTNLLLPNWREYEIIDRKRIYFVRLPLIHELLKSEILENLEMSFLAISQVAFCDCEYFASNLICSHLVAVCAEVDSEYKNKFKHTLENKSIHPKNSNLSNPNSVNNWENSATPKTRSQISQKVGDSLPKSDISTGIFTQIINWEVEKLETVWLNNWHFYLNNSVGYQHRFWFKKAQFLKEVAANKEFSQQFLARISQDFGDICRDFYQEKNLIQLAAETVLAGGKPWYDFWQKEFGKMLNNSDVDSLKNYYQKIDLTEFWWSMWNMRNQTQIRLIWLQIEQDLANLEKSQKDKIWEKMSQNKGENPKIYFKLYLEMALALDLTDWLDENLENMEPFVLIRIIEREITKQSKKGFTIDQNLVQNSKENKNYNSNLTTQIIQTISNLWENTVKNNYKNLWENNENWQINKPQNSSKSQENTQKNSIEKKLANQNHLSKQNSNSRRVSDISSCKNFLEIDKIEKVLKQKIIIWSNFLESGNYEEIVEILKLWQTTNWSEIWQETIEIIALEHSKKPKLIKFLSNLCPEIGKIKTRKLQKKSQNFW